MRLLYLILFLLYCSYSYANSSANKADSLLEFTKGFKVEFEYTVEKVATNSQIIKPNNIERIKYKSTKPFAEDSSGKWFMRFSLDIIQYKDAEEAKGAFEDLREKTKGIFLISKCQDYIVQKGHRIYWISTPCHFWNISKLERQFNIVMKIPDVSIGNAIRCKNGGFCE
ncbi:hypothetical protein [Teredinibacter sp. KSP-S5-2]|uniref:hypothetical protein n=1 Tax=Teredinibacter sp. KSP-S5-2 TaxID=3034506 RepID=UPI002935299C|nr:hypothetical protein [Teredinibacter sp. KSP-S5-2]WNO08624.1 hypothetical protein P5V12_16765 [Teredinibacter sp. KSP-S5-2]